jgi:hypothetical protein
MYIHANIGVGQTLPASASDSLFQKIQNALAGGQWYVALTLAVLAGLRDENKLTNMIFFARHPERGGRKLEQSDPNFKQLSQEWLDIRRGIVRPFLDQIARAQPSTAKPTTPVTGGKPYPEVNTPLPQSGAGFARRGKTAERAYGLPEMIQALTEIAAAWHAADPTRPRIVISDISRQGGGKLSPHSSHRVGLDVDLRLEGGKSAWYEKRKKSDDSYEWQLNSAYSRSLTQALADVILDHPTNLKIKFILFDDPKISRVKKDDSSPHLNHFHVRFCAPAYFASKVDKRYKSCS